MSGNNGAESRFLKCWRELQEANEQALNARNERNEKVRKARRDPSSENLEAAKAAHEALKREENHLPALLEAYRIALDEHLLEARKDHSR